MRDKRNNEDYLTVKQIAKILNVSEKKVRDYIKCGGLEPKKTHKRRPYRVHKAAFKQWLEDHTTKQGEQPDE